MMPPNESAKAGTLAQALLAPRSVAIVGQSNDAGKTAGRPLKYLRQAGYAGRLYPINPGRETVLGERAWPSWYAFAGACFFVAHPVAVYGVAYLVQRSILMATLFGLYPFLLRLYADGGYQGPLFRRATWDCWRKERRGLCRGEHPRRQAFPQFRCRR